MQRALSSRDATPEVSHVVAAIGGASALVLALANGLVDTTVGYGAGVEIALARSGDADEAPEWVQLFPKGPVIKARDGREWTLPDPQAVVAAFVANQGDLPFDINHATEILAPKGDDAPAQGWIKGLEVRDGQVWARVEWNAAGRQAVAGKAYRYVSPAFRHTKDGLIIAVTSAALVTHPALVMPALAHQQPNPLENSMSLAARLAAVLGLAATATEDQVFEAVSPTISLARDARDPTKLVPAADLTAALARATAAEATIASADAAAKETAAVAAVDAAVAAGKISPGGKEHWLSIARATPEAFATAIAGMTPTLTPPKPDTKVDGDTSANHGLTEQQVSVARSLGLELAAYAASLKE